VKEYYARRAAEYDATSWEAFDEAERETVERFVASLPPGRILDICTPRTVRSPSPANPPPDPDRCEPGAR
jgi:hypothetical protein